MFIKSIINTNIPTTIPSRFKSMIPSLVASATTSDINFQLSAAIIRGSKFITPACANVQKNSCKGNCGSLHAEAHAILTHYRKDLSYSDKLGWCYQPRNHQGKRSKGQEFGYYCHSC
jgi:hypothetical protein